MVLPSYYLRNRQKEKRKKERKGKSERKERRAQRRENKKNKKRYGDCGVVWTDDGPEDSETYEKICNEVKERAALFLCVIFATGVP